MSASVARSRRLRHAGPLAKERYGNAKGMADGDDGEAVASAGASVLRSELVGLGTRDRNDPRSLYDGEELAMTPTRTPRAGLGAGIGWANESVRPAVDEFLGLTPPAFVRTIISLGHPTAGARQPKSQPGTARRPLADVVREL